MNYKIRVDVHKWKKDQMVSETDLLSEGVNILQWIKEGLLFENKPEVVTDFLDLNKDGVRDDKDAKIASETLNFFKKKKSSKVM